MIYSLNGTLIHQEPGFVVIECGGVGFKCLTTMNTMKALPPLGEKATLYTHMIVREDALELCGFSSASELDCFRLLTSVSGVGAKVAVAILSELNPEQLAVAVSSSDTKALTRASGVGNKLAQRIILEMKDKVKKLGIINTAPASMDNGSAPVMPVGNIAKAVSALAVLGYTPDEVTPFMSGLDENMTVEQMIGATLRAIGKK